MQGIYAERLPRRFIYYYYFFFSSTQDFAFAPTVKQNVN